MSNRQTESLTTATGLGLGAALLGLMAVAYPWLGVSGAGGWLSLSLFVLGGLGLSGWVLGALAGRSRHPGAVIGAVIGIAAVAVMSHVLSLYGRSPVQGVGLIANLVLLLGSGLLGLTMSRLARHAPSLQAPVLPLLMGGLAILGAATVPPPPLVDPLPPPHHAVGGALAGNNVLLITVDTLRADHLSMYGYHRQTSPEMDALGQRGVIFDAPMTQKTHTAPATASLMTGTYPHTHRLRANQTPLAEDNLTLAELLSAAGYRTAAFSTNGWLSRTFGFDQGFDEFTRFAISQPGPMATEAATVNEAALPWLAENRSEQPFFLWLHYVDPHGPYIVPPEYEGLFEDDAHADLLGDASVEIGAMRGRLDPKIALPGVDDMDTYVSRYDAEIRYLDDHLAEIFAQLDALNLTESTLVILTADHGESLSEHDYYCFHGEVTYETEARVPLVIQHPSLRRGARVRQPVELVDVVPTVLDLVGVSTPEGVEGDSLVNLLTSYQEDPEAVAFIESRYRVGYTVSAVRTQDWKLIYSPVEQLAPVNQIVEWTMTAWRREPVSPYACRIYDRELYEIASDPGELSSRYDDAPPVLSGLEDTLHRWVGSAGSAPITAATPLAEMDAETIENLRALGYIH